MAFSQGSRANTSLLLYISLLVLTAFASPLDLSVSASRWKHLALGTKGSFLVDAAGCSFFWQADTAWELFHRLNHSEVIRYLDDRKAKGFTVVMSVAIPEYKYTLTQFNFICVSPSYVYFLLR